jgi:hypothetical protein
VHALREALGQATHEPIMTKDEVQKIVGPGNRFRFRPNVYIGPTKWRVRSEQIITAYGAEIDSLFIGGWKVSFSWPDGAQDMASIVHFYPGHPGGYFEPVTATVAVETDPRFPHKCPRCGSPSYNGGGPADVDCTSAGCPTKKR